MSFNKEASENLLMIFTLEMKIPRKDTEMSSNLSRPILQSRPWAVSIWSTTGVLTVRVAAVG